MRIKVNIWPAVYEEGKFLWSLEDEYQRKLAESEVFANSYDEAKYQAHARAESLGQRSSYWINV